MAHTYVSHLVWHGNLGDGTSSYVAYGREYRVLVEGKPELTGSADPAYRGDAALHNPEDLFLASLAACHMLSYLALCARQGVRVIEYEDRARGTLVTDSDGGGRFESVTLAPVVTVADGSDEALAAQLHDTAHARCFIASSCSTPVRHEVTIRVAAGASHEGPGAGPRIVVWTPRATRAGDVAGTSVVVVGAIARFGYSTHGEPSRSSETAGAKPFVRSHRRRPVVAPARTYRMAMRRKPGTTHLPPRHRRRPVRHPYSGLPPHRAAAMSRKSRSRSKLELVREPATEPAADDRLTVHRLTGELQETLEAIISACAFLAKGPIPPGLLEPESEAEADEPLDDAALDALDADLDDVGRALDGVSFTTRILARALIARTLDRHPLHVAPLTDTAQSAAEAVVENAALDDFARALTPSSFPPELRPSRTERKAAFDDAAFLVREVGLEEFDVSCDLDTGDDGVPELLTVPVSPETAHVELLEFLFERAEGAMLQQDAFLAIERDASSWEFSRWSVSPPPGRGAPDVMHFARRVREEEYSLVERPCVALGRTMMNEIADDDGFAELFPRQHRMAEALSASFVDVFECLAVDGSRVTMRSIRDGETYAVHEHLEPVEYSKGWVGAGRLIPFDGELHLRSPGMVFTRARDLELARAAANDVDALRDVLPPALVVEAFISTAMFGVNVPREMKPARSRAEAREVLAELQLALADGEVQLDPTLEGFVSALADQGAPGPVGTARSGTGARRKAKGKPKRRR